MGVKSSVVVPIVLEKAESTGQDAPAPRELDQLWGLLVSHHAEPRVVSSNELDFIQSVVDQVSIAISPSVLLKQVREQARREADVNRVTALLYTSATVQLQQALEEAVIFIKARGVEFAYSR